MLHPRISWTTSEFFDQDSEESDGHSPEYPESAGDDSTAEDTPFWDQMIFPL